MNNKMRIAVVIVAVVALAAIMFQLSEAINSSPKSKAYSEFITDVTAGKVKAVSINDNVSTVETSDSTKYTVVTPNDPSLVERLLTNKVKVTAIPAEKESIIVSMLVSWLPTLFIIALIFFIISKITKRMPGGGGALSMGKSKAKQIDASKLKVTLKDVAGCDEAKEEVQEIVEFLKEPGKFQKLGGKIPRGAILVGPPGTGKTLLAKAIAGEAKVPFFTVSGSDFVEMFVGVGASRVRDLFAEAKKAAPCIVFIDEIDAVGRKRGNGNGGGNDEREQTLNQLLVEMDGFEGNSGVIVIAATNRVESLDNALLRPGRFDRRISVGLPDIKGREQILSVHMRKVPVGVDVSINELARGTPGFSGAELANMVNEAAIFAARKNKRTISAEDFEDAKDKIFMGPERKSMIMREDERKNTAYHESGHAVVAALLPTADPVHKVTIMPRGFALGLTWQLPEHDKVNNYKTKMLEEISILFGGRLAEEIFMNQISTGASNDFERATAIARAMVTKYGMSDLGLMVFKNSTDEYGIGVKGFSEDAQQKIEAEINKILNAQYALAKKLLEDNRDKVEAMTQALLKFETINSNQINKIMQGLPVDDEDHSDNEGVKVNLSPMPAV